MIKNRTIFYLAIVAAALGAIRHHAERVENKLNIPGMIEGNLPDTKIWIGLTVLFVILSLLSFRRIKIGKLGISRSQRDFVKEDSSKVAKRIVEMSRRSTPDIPLIVDYIIFQAIAAEASDIHFDPSRDGFTVRFRTDGMMSDIARIRGDLTKPIANRFKVLSNLVVYQGYLPQDGRLESTSNNSNETGENQTGNFGSDFRIAFMPTLHGERIVIRILGRSGNSFDFTELGMSEAHQQMMRRYVAEPQGMVIFTGPTGSGKTTTIYTALRAIQDQTSSKRSISTLEDPIEYEIQGINQSQVNEKKGFTFAKGLRAILRQDPDVILVGEIRDLETAKTAIQAGMTGHLIITTVHANSSTATFSRLIEMGVAPHSLNSAVTAVVAQRLVRKICISCKKERRPSAQEIDALNLHRHPANTLVYEGQGCAGCNGSGYSGRYALYEILNISEGIRNMVAQDGTAGDIYRQAHQEGMINLFDSGIDAVTAGITTPEEIVRVLARYRQ